MRRRAFTLGELLMVVVIIGIVVSRLLSEKYCHVVSKAKVHSVRCCMGSCGLRH